MALGASANLTVVAGLQDKLSGPLNNIQKSTGNLEKQFTKLSGAAQNAFQFYVRYRIFGIIQRGVSALENAIPGLIARGQEWAATVDDIADSSGLAAEKSSLLAGMVTIMAGNADGLTKALGALSQQAVNHGDVMQRYGIKTRDANGRLLDSWTILMNVRKALSDLGNGFITTAAARDMFSRGGQTLMDFLTMSDKQVQMLTRDIKESGVIMTEAGLKAAEAWQRTQQRFEMQITGIANQITMGVQPLLTGLVDAITDYLRQNMAQIVGFVTQVIAFAANAVAGFLGIDISKQMEIWAVAFDKAAKGKEKRERDLAKGAKTRDQQTDNEDGYTRALNGQIDAIDRQIEALDRRGRAEDARREQAELMRDIADARKELEEIRSKSIFAAGMSYAEAELARQAQAADIVAAQKRLGEAQQKLREQERDNARDDLRLQLQDRKEALQERLADHMKMLAKQAAADREVLGQIFSPSGAVGKLPEGVAEALKKAFEDAKLGTGFGKELRTHFDNLTKTLSDTWTSLSTSMPTWLASLKTIGGHLDNAAKILQSIIDWISSHNPFGTEEGQINLGIEPGNIALAGLAAWLSRGALTNIARTVLPRMVGGLFPGAGAAAAGAASAVTGAASGAVAGAAASGAAATAATVASTLAILARGASVASLGYIALKALSGGVSDEEAARRLGLKPTERTKETLQNTGVTGAFGFQKSFDDTLHTLFGGFKLHELWEGQKETAAATASSLAEIGAGVGPTSQFNTSQLGIASALSDEAPLVVSSKSTADALGPSGDIPSLLREVATYTQRMSNPRPGTIWGVANMNVYLDKELVLELAGVPIRQNSSTRAQRAN